MRSDGTVYAWGSNSRGQLGDGTTTSYSSTPAGVSGLTAVTAIAGGFYNGYAARSDGTVYAWGFNGHRQLGDGTTNNKNSSTPVQVTGLTGITAIAAGSNTGYALHSQ